MKTEEFANWMGALAALTPRQRESLLSALESPDPMGQVVRVLEATPISECPHCHTGAPRRYGRATGLQRYKCHGCDRTFNSLTGTPLSGLHRRGQWQAFAQALIDGDSVRKSARRVGLHRNTAFRWRHRFLAAAATMQASLVSGIAEADETLVRRSAKGSRQLKRKARKRGGDQAKPGRGDDHVCVLVLRDRAGHTLTQTLESFNHTAVDAAIGVRLDRDAVLCSDSAPVYARYCTERGLLHEPVNLSAGQRVRQRAFHVQNVNAYHSRLKGWLRRFNGVATRYLPNYLAWHRMLDALGPQARPMHLLRVAHGVHYQQCLVT